MPQTTPLITAITLNWNRPDDTVACLESLYAQDYPRLRLLLVDNGSQDGSPAIIARRFPQLEQLALPENLGFAAGFNAGMQHALQAGADLVFIVNNDTLLAPDCISQLAAQVRPETGILSPLIYYAQEPDVIWALAGRVHPLLLEKTDPWAEQRDPGDWPERIPCDFVTGCAMLLPRRTLELTGGFDEGFRMYYEDSDLCQRVRRAGLEIAAAPLAHLWHKVARSSGGRDTPNERYWMARSSLRYFRKHAHGRQIPAIFFWRLGSALRTSLRLARRGRWQALRAYWRGLRHGLQERVQP